MDRYSNIKTADGEQVFSLEYIQSLRDADEKKADPFKIIAQNGGQENMLATRADIMIGGGSRGGSKGEPYRAPVVTPFGIRRMGDLKVGDIISGVDGGMQRVIKITELGTVDVYRFHFSDGTHVDCTEDHIWKFRRIGRTKKQLLNNGDCGLNWRLATTEQLLKRVNGTKGHFVIPLCGEVRFTRSFAGWHKPHFSPYIYSALIGDGCMVDSLRTGRKVAMLTTADEEIVSCFKNEGVGIQYIQERVGCRQVYFDDTRLEEDLQKLGLAGRRSEDKFIPLRFQYGSVDERWALVQGLMDTDGTADTRGHCSYSTVSRQLAEDMAFVLRSLGAYVTITGYKAGYNGKDGGYIRCKDVYCLYIKMNGTERLFRLARKRERCRKYNGGISEPTKRILSIEKLPDKEECRCIGVSNPDALYMTNDFTVTHNSFSLLMEALKDIYNKNFHALLMRKEIDDLDNLVKDSQRLYGDFGKYNRSKNDMTWNFNYGGDLTFSYHAGTLEDFKNRFQGRQYAFVGIDEITHIDFQKFKYIVTCNRNAFHIRNRVIGTCNPDPDSWVAKFIDWWIGEDGLPIRERDGVVRYCFMKGDDVGEIIWGNTREEVYESARQYIDRLFLPGYERFGHPKDIFVKSVAFVEARLAQNVQLLRSDPGYLGNLAGQSDEMVARDLEGNWKFRSVGTDLIKLEHMEAFFRNPYQLDDKVRRVSCDVAFEGGDNLVMWMWIGHHVQDVFVCKHDSQQTVSVVKAKLMEWGVMEQNFTYDLNGLGQIFKGFFPKAVPFNNRESVDPKFKFIYANLKSQAAYLFMQKLTNLELSINENILDYRFSGKGYKNKLLTDILKDERKAIKQSAGNEDKGFCLISKPEMIKLIGHSPDFIEALFMRMIFDIKRTHHKPINTMRYINPYTFRR